VNFLVSDLPCGRPDLRPALMAASAYLRLRFDDSFFSTLVKFHLEI
jgi:hypothetical protein